MKLIFCAIILCAVLSKRVDGTIPSQTSPSGATESVSSYGATTAPSLEASSSEGSTNKKVEHFETTSVEVDKHRTREPAQNINVIKTHSGTKTSHSDSGPEATESNSTFDKDRTTESTQTNNAVRTPSETKSSYSDSEAPASPDPTKSSLPALHSSSTTTETTSSSSKVDEAEKVTTESTNSISQNNNAIRTYLDTTSSSSDSGVKISAESTERSLSSIPLSSTVGSVISHGKGPSTNSPETSSSITERSTSDASSPIIPKLANRFGQTWSDQMEGTDHSEVTSSIENPTIIFPTDTPQKGESFIPVNKASSSETTRVNEPDVTTNYQSFSDTTQMSRNPSESITIGTVVKTDTTLTVSWEAPHLGLNYQVKITSLGPNHVTPSDCSEKPFSQLESTTELSYTFRSLSPDFNYNVDVATTIDNETVRANVSVTTDTAAPGKPRKVTLETTSDLDTTKILRWEMPCHPNGEIANYTIEYKGVYMLNKQKIDSRTKTTTSREFSITNLLPLSHYALNVTAVGTNGKKGAPFNITFVTRDTIPEAPVVSIDQQSSSGFSIHWKLNPNQLGNITKFRVNITSQGPEFSQNPNCTRNPTGLIVNELERDSMSYLYQEGLPYHNYMVSVAAISSRSVGHARVMSVLTNSSVPEPSEDLFFDIDNTTMFAKLSWKLPCNINGPISHTKVQISGAYTEDSNDVSHYEKNFDFTNEKWYYEYPNITLRDSFSYNATITIVLQDGTEGTTATTTERTSAGIPGKPTNIRQKSLSSSSFAMAWDPPKEHRGKIIGYEAKVNASRPLYYIPPNCPQSITDFNRTLDGSTTNIDFDEAEAFYSYSIYVKARTEKGFGNSAMYSIKTNQSRPQIVEDLHHDITLDKSEKYNGSVNISFRRPCFTNGPLRKFVLHYVGTRDSSKIENSQVQEIQDTETADLYAFEFALEPETEYTYNVSVDNDYFYSMPTNGHFKSPSGVPIFSLPSDYLPVLNVGTENAEIVLQRNLLNHTNGNVKYVSLIVGTKNSSGGEIQVWDGEHWPTINGTEFLQITPNRWNPFNEATMDTVTFLIGNETSCISADYCNKPLEPNKEYYLIVRIFTNNFYRNSQVFRFQTEEVNKIGFIVGILSGILGVAIIGIAAFFLWRKGFIHNKIERFLGRTSAAKSSETKSASISCGKFIQYCIHLENNPEKLKEQYNLITENGKEIVAEKSKEFANLPENKRKNRYINILPFDDTRVKLLIDEDDEIGSDYINASYIKGYSGQVEYIATQGPLETTCRDFWKMVIQENVSIIVMVAQFTENDKIKCHKYFPKNHENLTIADDMEVRCATELHFGTYCVRNLQIRRDTSQVTVTHMQFLEWPDFGVPNGTENMLQFCYQLRERFKIEGGMMLVHCSAGVGRTGTLIATDILLQTVNARREIDIFKTVMELRKQRIYMVQTEKQYIYLHTLLKDHLDRPPSPDLLENGDPVYENMDIINQSENEECKWKEQESEF